MYYFFKEHPLIDIHLNFVCGDKKMINDNLESNEIKDWISKVDYLMV